MPSHTTALLLQRLAELLHSLALGDARLLREVAILHGEVVDAVRRRVLRLGPDAAVRRLAQRLGTQQLVVLVRAVVVGAVLDHGGETLLEQRNGNVLAANRDGVERLLGQIVARRAHVVAARRHLAANQRLAQKLARLALQVLLEARGGRHRRRRLDDDDDDADDDDSPPSSPPSAASAAGAPPLPPRLPPSRGGCTARSDENVTSTDSPLTSTRTAPPLTISMTSPTNSLGCAAAARRTSWRPAGARRRWAATRRAGATAAAFCASCS
jgi:hypothetical protein